MVSILFRTKCFLFYNFKSMDKVLKNNYIISNKTSINNENNTNKKRVCNQQEISLL